MKNYLKLMIVAALAVFAVTNVEARHHHGRGRHHHRGGYYAPRFRPAHYCRGSYYGPYYGCNPYAVHGIYRVYEKPVVATRTVYQTTTVAPNVVETTVVEAPPRTSYYNTVRPWQPGVTIVTPTTTTYEAPVVNPPSTVYVVPERPKLLDVGAKVNVLGVGVGAGVDIGL